MKEMINSYDKLNLKAYMDLSEVLSDPETDKVDKNLTMVSILTGIDEMDLYEMPVGRFNHLLQNSAFLLEEPKKVVVKESYSVGGYTLIPQFAVETMTTAQFIDYQTYVKDVDRNTVQLLSVLMIPDGHSYNDGYDLEDVMKAIGDHLMIEDALALSAFFLQQYRAWFKAILTSLRRQLKKISKMKNFPKDKKEELLKQIALLEKGGDGLL